ncbi:hypothetical protein ACFX14_018806 [Malus domestica]
MKARGMRTKQCTLMPSHDSIRNTHDTAWKAEGVHISFAQSTSPTHCLQTRTKLLFKVPSIWIILFTGLHDRRSKSTHTKERLAHMSNCVGPPFQWKYTSTITRFAYLALGHCPNKPSSSQ